MSVFSIISGCAPVGSSCKKSERIHRGLPTVDHRTDVYSFGSVLYEMTTGERPFQHNNSYDLLQAAVVEDPPPPSSIVPEIPEALESVILRAMSKEPDQRFQSAKEFLLPRGGPREPRAPHSRE